MPSSHCGYRRSQSAQGPGGRGGSEDRAAGTGGASAHAVPRGHTSQGHPRRRRRAEPAPWEKHGQTSQPSVLCILWTTRSRACEGLREATLRTTLLPPSGRNTRAHPAPHQGSRPTPSGRAACEAWATGGRPVRSPGAANSPPRPHGNDAAPSPASPHPPAPSAEHPEPAEGGGLCQRREPGCGRTGGEVTPQLGRFNAAPQKPLRFPLPGRRQQAGPHITGRGQTPKPRSWPGAPRPG